MEADLAALADTAGAALVTVLVGDLWQRATAAIGTLWRRMFPDQDVPVQYQLEVARSEVLAARETGDQGYEQELVARWQIRLRQLLAEDPATTELLREVLAQIPDDQHPATARPEADCRLGGDLQMRAYDQSRIYLAARDQYIVER
jgi:hypothetical protein